MPQTSFTFSNLSFIFSRWPQFCAYGIALAESFYGIGVSHIVLYQLVRYYCYVTSFKSKSLLRCIYMALMISIGVFTYTSFATAIWITVLDTSSINEDPMKNCVLSFNAPNNGIWYKGISWKLDLIFLAWDIIVICKFIHSLKNNPNKDDGRASKIALHIIMYALIYQLITTITVIILHSTHMNETYHYIEPFNILIGSSIIYIMHNRPKFSGNLCCSNNSNNETNSIQTSSNGLIMELITTKNQEITSTLPGNNGYPQKEGSDQTL